MTVGNETDQASHASGVWRNPPLGVMLVSYPTDQRGRWWNSRFSDRWGYG